MRVSFTLVAASLTATLLLPSASRAEMPQGAATANIAGATTDAIDGLAGRIVTAIHVDVEGRRTDEAAVLALINIERNRPLNLAELRASIMQLHNVARFDDIRVRGVAAGAGVELIFDLVPRHPVDSVGFTGVDEMVSGDLERDLRQRFNGLPRGAQADAVARAVERTLAERGYRSAKVRPTLETSHLPDRATLMLAVDAGPLTVVRSAKVEGVSPLAPSAVLKRANVVVGQPYRSREIDLGLDALIEDLRGRGYYEATVSHTRDVLSPDGRSADVIITVESAVPVILKFAGDSLPGKAADLVPIKREGSVDDDLLEDSVRRIEAALRRDGYWKGTASFAKSTTPAGKVITITVRRGVRYRFERLEVSGNTQMTTESIALLVTLEPDALFDESRVARGVAAIRDAYRLQGYAAATVTATAEALPPVKPDADPHVIERVVIDEGVQTKVADVTVTGASHLTPAEITAVMRLRRDGPFVAGLVPADREAVRQKYDSRGYGSVAVELRVRVNDDRTRATIQVDVISEGPQTVLGHVIIAGNRRVSDETIRKVVALKTGQPLGMGERIALQQRLSAMALFRRVTIAEGPPGGDAGTDLVITVEESPTTSYAYGGGLEAGLRARSVLNDNGDLTTVDKFEVAPRASFEIGRTNLWGKNRSVNFSSGVSLRPKDAPSDPTEDGKCCGFSEYRVNGSFRERTIFGWNANGLISVGVEQAIRNSFTFVRENAGVQMLRPLAPKVSFVAGYSLERVRLSNQRIAASEQLLVDRLFPTVRLSVLSASVFRDTRTDQLSPTDGVQLSADTNLAMRAIGSQFGFAKVLGQAFIYRQLPSAPRIVLAGGARIGLLRGFARDVVIEDANGNPTLANGVPVTTRVEDVHVSQRFFSGGGTTVRGFQQDRLGAPNVLNADGLSNGGNGLMVFNAEIRTAITRELGLATFVDAGNVFSKVGDMTLRDLRTSVGAGIRYRSPLGPLRFDVGWKVGALRVSDARRWEFHFSIGEAF